MYLFFTKGRSCDHQIKKTKWMNRIGCCYAKCKLSIDYLEKGFHSFFYSAKYSLNSYYCI